MRGYLRHALERETEAFTRPICSLGAEAVNPVLGGVVGLLPIPAQSRFHVGMSALGAECSELGDLMTDDTQQLSEEALPEHTASTQTASSGKNWKKALDSPKWPQAKNQTSRSLGIAAAVVLVAGAVLGGVLGFISRPAVATTEEYRAMEANLTEEVEAMTDKFRAENEKVIDARAKSAELMQREAAVADSEASLLTGQASLKAGQDALAASLQQVEKDQFSDGMHLVGTNVTPGIYAISTSTRCYYAWKSGTGSDAEIVDNEIVNGPATVTLKAGEVFESNRCGKWSKVG